jgi:hypothetical protein
VDDLLRRYENHECGEDGYPFSWHKALRAGDVAIKDLIRELAENRCLRCGHPKGKVDDGWSDCGPHCKHYGTGPVPDQRAWNFETEQWALGRNDRFPAGQLVLRGVRLQARWRILTVHHLDEDKANCLWWNLCSLCQRCHLRMQRAVVMDRPWYYEHTEWFKPFAAGFYAWKYEGLELDRTEVEERLEELLAHEERFKRERLILDG